MLYRRIHFDLYVLLHPVSLARQERDLIKTGADIADLYLSVAVIVEILLEFSVLIRDGDAERHADGKFSVHIQEGHGYLFRGGFRLHVQIDIYRFLICKPDQIRQRDVVLDLIPSRPPDPLGLLHSGS